MSNTESESAFYRISEVETLTGVSRQTLYRWRQKGDGPPWVKPGSVVLYPKEGFWEWAEREGEPGDPGSDTHPPAS